MVSERTDVEPQVLGEREESQDRALRPTSFEEFEGQEEVVANLKVYIAAARERKEAMDHVLLSGMPGLGKTTLAYLVAQELGVAFCPTSGPVLDAPPDLLGLLTKLARGDVLFIDETHRLNPKLEEYLYSAMEDFVVDLVIDKGPSARSFRLPLQPFTLVGATTREGLLSDPFRARFGVFEKLMPYPPETLARIVARSARKLGVQISGAGALLLSQRSRGTPRIANRFLRRIRDMAQIAGTNVISEALVVEGLTRLGVDQDGLDPTDRRILSLVAAQGGIPVGLKTIAVALGEEERTIEDVYEPYLIQRGLLLKTPRGRTATPDAEKIIARWKQPPEGGAPEEPTA
jgi:holliday junction DNA helicase RuvB